MNFFKITLNKRWLFVYGGVLLTAFAAFLLFAKPAGTQTASAPDESPALTTEAHVATLGKLTFSRFTFTAGVPILTIHTANPDGSGATTFDLPYPPYAPLEPTWSPDGMSIAFRSTSDIYSFNLASPHTVVNLTRTLSDFLEAKPSWSVSGKIAYTRDNQIWVMNADGTNQMPFPGITQSPADAPAWSPDGSKLAFASNGEIWVINSDGTGERRVTNNSTIDLDPDWSGDGTKITFSRNNAGISVINLDGSGETPLTAGNDRKPAWSHDNTKIAFVRRNSGVAGIYLMNPDGSNQIRIIADDETRRGNQNDDPAWQPVAQQPNAFSIAGRIALGVGGLAGVTVNLSGTVSASTVTNAQGSYQFSNLPAGGNYTVTPSLANYNFTPPNRTFNNLTGSQVADFTAAEICQGANCGMNGKIAFVRGTEIYSMNADGTNQTNLTNNPAGDFTPDYSPDGSRIVFSSTRDGNFEIYRMNEDGTNVVRLTNNSAIDTDPSYSPDGSRIVFSSTRDGNYEIYSMNADGSNQVRLTSNSFGDSQPSYSPDGSKIIFVGNTIMTMNADGSNQTPLTTVPGLYQKPSYSPDGSKIVFIHTNGPPVYHRIYTMNADGTNRVQFPAVSFPEVDPSYSPDGRKIVFAYQSASQQNPSQSQGIWIANADATAPVRLTVHPDYQPTWQPRRARPVLFDFNGDRRADISVFRPSNGYWYVSRGSNTQFDATQFGTQGDLIAPADYDADGRADIAVFRPTGLGDPTRAYFFILQSANNAFRYEQFGNSSDVPVSGDFDGDGRADLAVYRAGSNSSEQSYFYYRPTSAPGTDFRSIQWGIGGDKQARADYDGDGKLDAAVFRPSTSRWYVLKSSDNQVIDIQFGISEDIPTPADFDGDGRANFAVYRPSTGWWYRSTNPQTNYDGIQFGQTGDTPVAADYDGDGRADVAVFRPSNGVWYLQQTTNGFAGQQFGANGDKPVVGAYLP